MSHVCVYFIIIHYHYNGIDFVIPSGDFIPGSTAVVKELEDLFSQFLGCESVMTFGMGFGTNSLNMPALMEKVNNFLAQKILGIFVYCSIF